MTNTSVPFEKRNYFADFNIEGCMQFLNPKDASDFYGDSSEIKKVMRIIQRNEIILRLREAKG